MGLGPCKAKHVTPLTPRASAATNYGLEYGGNQWQRWGCCQTCGLRVASYPKDGYTAKHNVKCNPTIVERALALWLARGGPCSKKLMDALISQIEAEEKANSSRHNPRTAGTHYVPPTAKAKPKAPSTSGPTSSGGPPPPAPPPASPPPLSGGRAEPPAAPSAKAAVSKATAASKAAAAAQQAPAGEQVRGRAQEDASTRDRSVSFGPQEVQEFESETMEAEPSTRRRRVPTKTPRLPAEDRAVETPVDETKEEEPPTPRSESEYSVVESVASVLSYTPDQDL